MQEIGHMGLFDVLIQVVLFGDSLNLELNIWLMASQQPLGACLFLPL